MDKNTTADTDTFFLEKGLVKGLDDKWRCFGGAKGQEDYGIYHDTEWGVTKGTDRELFEKISLEGAQAGLSWLTILRRRENYRQVYQNFDIESVANMSDVDLENILQNKGIIRNRLKVFSVRKNARCVIELQKEMGSFSEYIWNFSDSFPVVNNWHTRGDVPVTNDTATQMSKDLKRKGFSFIGPTIIYSFLQSIGVINDHIIGCCCKK